MKQVSAFMAVVEASKEGGGLWTGKPEQMGRFLRKSMIILEECREHTLNEERKTERYQHVTGLTWKLFMHCQAQRNEDQSYILWIFIE